MAAPLGGFVQEALARQVPRTQIERVLLAEGWSALEVQKALAAWSDSAEGLPPVPRPMPSQSAREALFYTLKFMAYLTVIWSLGAIGFQAIDIATLPSFQLPEWRQSLSSWDLARLIIFLPLFVGLHVYNQRLLRQDQGLRRSNVRRWIGNGTLLVAALTALGDAVVVVGTALSGDLTSNLLFKALLIGVIALGSALFFRVELAEAPKA